jgi:SP family galactose:H+ symporter-like MFS transporter
MLTPTGRLMQGERFVRIAVIIASLGGMLFGYDTGVISGALLFVRKEFSLSSTMQELVVSAVLVGAVIGAIAGGTMADRFVRRRMIVLAGIIFTLSAIGTTLAPTINALIAGRIVVGIAIGMASFTSSMYMSEISPKRIRGSLVSINQLMVRLFYYETISNSTLRNVIIL